MTPPIPDAFWKLVAASRLVDPGTVDALRREYEGQAVDPASAPPMDAADVARWLVKRGVLTVWQAKRLARGESGPFFIGDYRLLARLEGDGPGLLCVARHEPSGRSVQLVLLNRPLCRQLETWTAIVRRTTIAHEAADASLSRTWALEQADGQRIIVCENLSAATLADELDRLGPLPVAAAASLVLQAARAVAELHRLGDIHGAISLDALRREPVAAGGDPRAGRVRLAQFPLAGDPHLHPPRIVADQPATIEKLGRRSCFIAPELMLPGRVCDTRSDVYALGCVFHALLTGALPCWKENAQQTLAEAAFVGPPPLGPPRVPVEIATLVGYMTARDPAARYPSAVEAADAIAACLGLGPVSPTLPPQRQFASAQAGAAAASPTGVHAAQPSSASMPAAPQPFADPSASFPQFDMAGSVSAGLPGAGPNAYAAQVRQRPDGAAESRRRSGLLRLIGLITVAGIGAAAAAVVFNRTLVIEEPGREALSKSTTATTAPPAEQPPMAAVEGGEPHIDRPPSVEEQAGPPRGVQPTIVDSPTLPWASPTTGRPPTLAYLPAGSQLILLARPADLAADEEGKLFITSLGPRVEAALAMLTQACGSNMQDIDEIQAGWRAGGPGESDVVGGYAVRLREAADEASLAKAVAASGPIDVGGETLHAGPVFGVWMPKAEEGRVVVFGPQQLVKEIIEAEAAAGVAPVDDDQLRAALPHDMELLVGMLDRSRHLTLIASPHYLLHDGRPVLAGPLAGLVEPLADFFGDAVKAAALSLHFGETFYAELDAIQTVEAPAKRLAADLGGKVTELAATVEDALTRFEPAPYGRKLVMRLPAMLRVLSANTRSAAEGKGAVINAYLPRHAGHNLALAAELALEQAPAAGQVAVANPAAPSSAAAAGRAGAAAALQKKITLTFAKDTLEKSIQMVSDEVGVPMDILGTDLQLEGITKNQSFGLDERDLTADQVLRVILSKADPVGRLVYVIRKTDDGETIEITTHAAVAKRGDTLPPGFPPPAAGDDAPKKKSK